MKTKLLILLASIYCGTISGQYFIDHIVTDNADAIYSVFSADINGDSNLDLLSVSTDDNKVAWYENTDGSGSFTEHIISTSITEPNDIYATDLDGDGDMDVLVAYWDPTDTLAWFENSDGQGNFNMHIVSHLLVGISVRAIDIDGDGDMDIIGAHKAINRIVWYENDGSDNFTNEHTITTEAQGVRTIAIGDFDSDGDWDVASNGQFDGKISWYENTDGNGNFTTHPAIITATNGAWRVSAGDIDGDGTDDILACVNDAEIYWCKYLGSGNWEVNEVTSNSLYTEWVYPVDLDSDGYMDVLSADQGDNQVVWYKNDGNQNFSKKSISQFGNGPRTVHAGDINGDGNIDVISGWWADDTVIWHEHSLGLADNTLSHALLYPSPTNGMINIESTSPITKINVYNLQGQLILSRNDQSSINISHLQSGTYLLELIDEIGNKATRKVIRN